MGIKWGTDSKVRMFDPMTGMHMELGASGEFNIRVVNARKFLLKVVGTTGGFRQDQLMGRVDKQTVSATISSGGSSLTATQEKTQVTKGYFRSLIMTQVKSYLAAAIRENAINVLEIDEHLLELGEALRQRINSKLVEYGLEMPEFFINRVVTPDDDPNFKRMKQQFADQYLNVREEQIKKNIAVAAAERKTVEAQTAAQMKIIGAQGDAEALKIQKQAEAEAYRMQAAAEAEEMRMKGYTYQQETARQVGLGATAAMGTAGAQSGLGDLAGLGISLGAMGSVVNMTRDALNPLVDTSSQMGQSLGGAIAAGAAGWDCACGTKNIQSKFCPECGAKKPEPKAADTWDCPNCGNKGITAKFCGECGFKRPEAPAAWDCPQCGNKGITAKFCGECGCKKPEAPAAWDCPNCGNKGITAKFCPECGHKRGE